jgi:hypothetical protein
MQAALLLVASLWGAARGIGVDCAEGNDDCAACLSVDYCKFVVTRGGLQDVSACVHWQDTKRLENLLGHLLVPGRLQGFWGKETSWREASEAPDTTLAMEFGGDLARLLKAKTAYLSEFEQQGASCPATWPPRAPWDAPSSVWEPVRGPGDLGSRDPSKAAPKEGDDTARFRQQRSKSLPLRLDSDAVPLRNRLRIGDLRADVP